MLLVLFLIFIVGFIVVGGGLLLLAALVGGTGSSYSVQERFYKGKSSASDKIAVIRIEGVILEGLTTNYVEKQIEQAASDNRVKAVVVRINSPGGSITASDQLYHLLSQLRDGETGKSTDKKPLVVSMGSLAASGGYYVAMPAEKLIAERTTITGSIGVYASLPNLKEAGEKVGFRMVVIKAGNVKDSGSFFGEPLDPKSSDRHVQNEYLMWQNMVDHAYLQFLDVVEKGRPELKGKLQDDLPPPEALPVRHGEEKARSYPVKRYRADGGIFTADQAKVYGLIDGIGYLDDAIDQAATLGALGKGNYKVVMYDRPPSLFGSLLGGEAAAPPPAQFDMSSLANAASPRLWYVVPQGELAGVLAAAGRSH